MDKDVVHIYNGILHEIGSFVEMWMDLETVIHRSKSERETQIMYINAYMWNLKKLV